MSFVLFIMFSLQKCTVFAEIRYSVNVFVDITEIFAHAKENRVWGWGNILIYPNQNAPTTHSDASCGKLKKDPPRILGRVFCLNTED